MKKIKESPLMRKLLMGVFFASVALIIAAASPKAIDKGKQYIVAKVGAKHLSKKVESDLEEAIVAGYKAKPNSVELKKGKDGMYLSWSFGVERVNYISVALKSSKGNYIIDFGGPLSLTNCTTNSGCSCCKTDCSCSKKNGGQEDCGSSACDKKEVDKVLPTAMVQSLLG